MIVEPGFLDHWKTKLLARRLGTETAPFCVLRLWEHCQQRRKDRFTGMTPDRLAAVCGWMGDAQVLWDVMIETFVDVTADGTMIVHDWAAANSGLIASWNNGRKGGRPKRDPEPAHELPLAGEDAPPVPSPEPIRQTAVELPERFPKTEREAVLAATQAGCPEAFALEVWNLAMARNGRDSRGQPIGSWVHYLKAQFQFSTNRKHEQAANVAGPGLTKRNNRQTSTRSDADF